MSPLFNLRKFQDSQKSTPESCRIHSNAMNDEELGSGKLLKLKDRMGDRTIQTFWKIGSGKKLGSPSAICTNFTTLRSLPDSCRMDWNIMNYKEFWSKKLLKLKNRRADQIIQTFCKIGSPPEIRSPLFNLEEISGLWGNSSWFMQNGLKSNEWQRIWV